MFEIDKERRMECLVAISALIFEILKDKTSGFSLLGRRHYPKCYLKCFHTLSMPIYRLRFYSKRIFRLAKPNPIEKSLGYSSSLTSSCNLAGYSRTACRHRAIVRRFRIENRYSAGGLADPRRNQQSREVENNAAGRADQ